MAETIITTDSPAASIAHKKFLVMDDDDSVRSAITMILTQMGHTVTQSKNVSETIEQYTVSYQNYK